MLIIANLSQGYDSQANQSQGYHSKANTTKVMIAKLIITKLFEYQDWVRPCVGGSVPMEG